MHEVVPPGWAETYPGSARDLAGRLTLMPAATRRMSILVTRRAALATVAGVRVLLKRSVAKAIVLTFNNALNPSSTKAKANYRLAAAGRDRRFGTRDDVKVRFRSVAYNSAARTVTMTPAGRLVLNKKFQLRLNAAGLIDLYGRPLDGNGDGRPGGDFVALITRRGATVTSFV